MLLDEFWFGFWEHWHCEKFGLGLYECVHGVCGKSLLAYVNFVLCTWKNFVGMCMDIFMGIGKLCGYEILIYEKNFVGYVMLILGKFLWL